MAAGVTQPGYALSDDPTKTAFSLAFNTELNLFSWYELAENQERLRTFGLAMEGSKNMFNPRVILEGMLDLRLTPYLPLSIGCFRRF
jgi:hypothetical protein